MLNRVRLCRERRRRRTQFGGPLGCSNRVRCFGGFLLPDKRAVLSLPLICADVPHPRCHLQEVLQPRSKGTTAQRSFGKSRKCRCQH
jgi:hypothetical protein